MKKIKGKFKNKLFLGLLTSSIFLGLSFTSCSVEVKNTKDLTTKRVEEAKKIQNAWGGIEKGFKESTKLWGSIGKTLKKIVKHKEKTNVLLEEILRVLKEKGTSGMFKEKRPQVAKETKQKLWVVYY